MVTTRRAFVRTPYGQIHVASAGEGFPVLLLHQTPRSWDEYREVLPLLGRRFRAIAMDTMGFGDSDALADGDDSIERWAEAAQALLEALQIERAAVVGHHTGAAIAIELAARAPKRVASLVLSSCPWVDAERRARRAGAATIDDMARRPSGEHLLELWRRRQPAYPEGDIDLLERLMVDALKAKGRAAGGHHCVNRYRMEERVGRVACPTLVVAATLDQHAYPSAARLAAAIAHSQRIDIDGGTVPLPDQMPDRFAEVVERFLLDVGVA
jgi:pimeloyl-ACP methyl ester carboxylesterase